MARTTWTDALKDQLRTLYPTTQASEIAAIMGVPLGSVKAMATQLGLRKSVEWIAQTARDRSAQPGHGGHKTRFGADGTAPWNKNTKGVCGLHPNTRINHFKPGQPNGRAKAAVLPIGTLRVNYSATPKGTLERKLTSLPGPYTLRWKPVHRTVWEAANGPVPAGHVVAFKPGRHTVVLEEITLDALELITRAQLMQRNSIHTQLPPELARVHILRGALTRQIKRATESRKEKAHG